jgi:uncharacterized membrane protein YkvA (DUF1232 family)
MQPAFAESAPPVHTGVIDTGVIDAETTVPAPPGWFKRLLERVSKRIGYRHLLRLASSHGQIAASLGDVPERMHRVASQTRLVLELLDDFKDGAYREIPWTSIAVIAGAVLYIVSPADIVPDYLIGVGILDDLAVMAVATRLIKNDLRKYCAFKGYTVEEYF